MVRLARALYGCVQSARLWYEKLRDALTGSGFEVNPYDLCTFNKMVDGEQLSIAFHVDDLLITSASEAAIDWLVSELEGRFAGVSATRGVKHSYLGMTITAGPDYYDLDMSGYLDKLLEGRHVKACLCPANDTLMEEPPDAEELDAAAQKIFHLDVAKVLYIAKRVRQMVLPATSVLAGRVNKATTHDREQLDRVFGYLLYSKDLCMRYKCGGKVSLAVYVDASWAVHHDCHGRTGIIVMMAGCSVGAWTFKQKIITRNSTESELVALSDATSHMMWYRRWLRMQGHDVEPITVYEDNAAVVALMSDERKTAQRTKHLSVRLFYSQELQQRGIIVLEWCSTDLMVADLMTKPLTGQQFHRNNMCLTGNTCMST